MCAAMESQRIEPQHEKPKCEVKSVANKSAGESSCKPDIDIQSVKVIENLNIKIADAKKLTSGNKDVRNCYCSVQLDREEVCKTRIVEKTLSPFFQEEFDFDIPRTFHYLCFYLHDLQGEVLSKRDTVFAKVVIKKSDLHNYNGVDRWYPLCPVGDNRGEAQGQIYVELKFHHYPTLHQSGNSEDSHKLSVKIPSCNGLFVSGGSCDPYITVTLQGLHRTETKRSRVKKATANPTFEDDFMFELNRNNNLRRSWFDLTSGNNEAKFGEQEHWSSQILKIAVFSSGTLGGDVFMGEVRMPLSDMDHTVPHTGWYLLKPREDKLVTCAPKEDFGSLRIKVTYTKDVIFPSETYHVLLQNLLQTAVIEDRSSSWPTLIGAICGTRSQTKAAKYLVDIFLQQGQLINLILPMADAEISSTKNLHMVFRNSTLVSTMIEESMRVVGKSYLNDLLSASLEIIKSENKCCEIDSTRGLSSNDLTNQKWISGHPNENSLSNNDQLQNNMLNLLEYVNCVVHSIVRSSSECPSILCEIFTGLRNSAAHHFPDDVNVKYRVVINFIFLRFILAALLCPRKYKIVDGNLSVNTSRTFTLISKVIQHMCTLSLPKQGNMSATPAYLNTFFNRFVVKDHMDSIRKFIDIISSTSNNVDSGSGQASTTVEKVTLKEGKMVKRAQGRTFLLGRKNFKTRYFSLTNYDLTYRKHKKSKPLCVIPVQQIKGIEKLQEDSFRMAYMFQVIQPNRVLYCKANNSVELKEWMDVLTRVCNCNRNRAQLYHPGAYIQGRYSCCGSTTHKAPGCNSVTGLPTSVRLNIDQDRDLERLYMVLSLSVDRIQALQEECGARAVYMGPKPECEGVSGLEGENLDEGETSSTTFVPLQFSLDIKDTRQTYRALCSIQECIEALDRVHLSYNQAVGDGCMGQGTKDCPFEGP